MLVDAVETIGDIVQQLVDLVDFVVLEISDKVETMPSNGRNGATCSNDGDAGTGHSVFLLDDEASGTKLGPRLRGGNGAYGERRTLL